MQTTPSFEPVRATAQPATAKTPSRRVTDAPTRMFHWLFALCFVGAYATADGEHWRLLHVTLGYTMAGLLGFACCTESLARALRAWACCGASWPGLPHGCAPCPKHALPDR